MRLILFLFIYTTFITAQTYYVDNNPNNDDANFRTIEEAIDNVQVGDTILIKAGTYHERIYIETSGTQAKPIVIKNYKNDKVIIDGTGITWDGTWGGLLHIDRCSYIKVSGLTIQHSTHAGIFLDNAHYVNIENMKTYDTFSSGIGVWNCSDIEVSSNEVNLACNDGEQECISVSNSHHVNVTYNEVHHSGPGTNGGEGIDIKEGSYDVAVKYNEVHHIYGGSRPGLYADAWNVPTHHILFDSNRVHHIAGNAMSVASEMGGPLKYVTFVNNIIYENADGGLIVGGWTAEGEEVSSNPVEHISIINNTFYNTGGDGIYIDNTYAKDIKIYNNIIQSRDKVELPLYMKEDVNLSEVDIRNNLVDSEPYSYGQIGDIVGDPLFVDATHGDFHLQIDSSAIDAGLQDNFSLLDYDKNSRLKNGLWDIGAYEYKKEPSTIDTDFAFLIPIWYLLL